jgi:hypothetical protein
MIITDVSKDKRIGKRTSFKCQRYFFAEKLMTEVMEMSFKGFVRWISKPDN